MRVKIEHVEVRSGFILKTTVHEVHLTVDFTHEEKQIVRQRFLMNHVLMERLPFDSKEDDDPDWYALQVKHLFDRKPDRFRFQTPSDAKAYQIKLTELMHTMKAWLDQNAETGGATVFEI